MLLSTVTHLNNTNRTGLPQHNFTAPHKDVLSCACTMHSLYMFWLFDAKSNNQHVLFPDLFPGDDEDPAKHWFKMRLIHVSPKDCYKEIEPGTVYSVYDKALKAASVITTNKAHAPRKGADDWKGMGVSDTEIQQASHWNSGEHVTHCHSGQQTD